MTGRRPCPPATLTRSREFRFDFRLAIWYSDLGAPKTEDRFTVTKPALNRYWYRARFGPRHPALDVRPNHESLEANADTCGTNENE